MTSNSGNNTEETELLSAYRAGVEVNAIRRPSDSTVLSVRLSKELLTDLTAYARKHDRPVGTVARELIEDGLVREHAASPQIVFEAARRAASDRIGGEMPGIIVSSATHVGSPILGSLSSSALFADIDRQRKLISQSQRYAYAA